MIRRVNISTIVYVCYRHITCGSRDLGFLTECQAKMLGHDVILYAVLKPTREYCTRVRESINKLYRHYEDPLKAPPAYSSLAPRPAFTFGVSRHLVHSPFLIVCLAPLTH